MVQNALEYLKTRKVNGEEYCFANIFILKDSDFYKYEIVPLNICMVIFLGFVFPLVLALFLIKGHKNKRLKRVAFERKLGILYLEYKEKNYYWELIIILMVPNFKK